MTLYSAALVTFLAGCSCSSPAPRILSALYGYDDCIGGVRGLQSEQAYLDDLRSRGCTVEGGRTNVAPRSRLMLTCQSLKFWQLSWLDGMPVVFNYPLQSRPAQSAVQLELSDGRQVSPVCVVLGPANEQNELDTLLLLGQFGDGSADTLRPVRQVRKEKKSFVLFLFTCRVSIVENITLLAPDGPVSALGLTYSNGEDFNYLTSTVRLTSAKLWDVLTNTEDFRPPTWPLPSSIYPNNCGSLYPNTSHVLRATFSGGVTTDGVTSVLPNNTNIFRLSTPSHASLPYLGLADLGQTLGEDLTEAGDYSQDGDNYVDICLHLAHDDDVLHEDLSLHLLCDKDLENSVLYPPKGKPHGCSPQRVSLSVNVFDPNIIMSWTV